MSEAQRSWSYAFASVIGTSHVRRDQPCQDYSLCVLIPNAGEDILVAVAADGAGSAICSQTGAKLACDNTLERLQNLLALGYGIDGVTLTFAQECVRHIQQEMTRVADEAGFVLRDYACTLLVAVVGLDRAVFWQIGDGAIVLFEPHQDMEYSVVFWPEKGEYENETVFVTHPEAAKQLECGYHFVRQPVQEFALMTDGLQRLALDFAERNAYSPFFRSMFAPLQSASEGMQETISASLAAFLQSERVNVRTDDDKTLVLASRLRAALLPGSEPAATLTDRGQHNG